MAACDDSLFISEGLSWSLWADNIGFKSPNSDHEDDETKTNREKTSTCLNREEMAIYGYCPRWEDFYLVVCNFCGKAIKPQALRQHIDLRHKGESNSMKSEAEANSKSSKLLKLPKCKSNSIKYETSQIDVDEPFHDSSMSPSESLPNESELRVEENNYKPIANRECNTILRSPNSLSRSCEGISSEGCDFLSMTEEIQSLPLIKMSVKQEGLGDSFLDSHLPPVCSLPPRLPPPVPPEPQHILPPPSPHAGPPPSIGPPTPGRGPPTPGRELPNPGKEPPTPGREPLTPGRGPPTPGREPPTPGREVPTPGRGPPTPVMGPSTPGVGPPTPGMGPPTPGMGPPTPGMGPPTPGLGPPTPNMRPPTPNMSPLTPVMGSSNSGVGQLTQGMVSQISSVRQQIPNQSQLANACPLTPTYVSQTQVQSVGSHTPNYGPSQGISPLTPHIPQSPNMDLSVPSIGAQTAGLVPVTQNLSQQLQIIRGQAVRIEQSPNTLVADNLNSVNITCGRGPSLTHQSQEVSRGAGRPVSIQNQSSAEEEVNRISAMLMKEAEELSYQGSSGLRDGNSGIQAISHDIVEAQGLAAGGMRQGSELPIGSINPSTSTKIASTTTSNLQVNSQTVNISQPLGSVPISMSSMSMATLNQIQADLLATVSESDLNAVLNATPDTPVLPNNSHCYDNGNQVQYSDHGTGTNEPFLDSPQMSNQGVIHYPGNDMMQMPVIEQINDLLADSDRSQNVYAAPTPMIQNQFHNSSNQISNSNQALQFSSSNDKNSQCDELTRAVDSITMCQDSGNTNLESHLGLVGLLQQPALSSNTSLQANNPSTLNSLSTPTTQGITVVIGGNQDNSTAPVSLSLTSFADSLKKSSGVSTINSNLITQLTSGSSGTGTAQGIVKLPCPNPLQNNQDQYSCQPQQTIISQAPKTPTVLTQHASLHTRTHQPQSTFNTQISSHSQTQYIQTFTQQSPSMNNQLNQSLVTQTQQQQQQQSHTYQNAATTVTPPTPSPKKTSKKKKPGERKLLPLKDREYDAEIHCGVLISDTGKPCTRSLTCKTHSLSLRRAVLGRSKKFDELLSEHKAAKEATMKASKPSEVAANLTQSAPSRVHVGMTSASGSGQLNGPSAHPVSNLGSSTTSSSLLVRTLGGTPTSHVTVPHPEPSPTSSHFHSMDPPTTPSHLQTTAPPSPAYWPSQRLAPPLCHSDNFFVRESPKPIAICSYNTRKLGGFLATDHKVDMLRSAFATALKKPQSGSSVSDSTINNNLLLNNTVERYNNVKPLLARKLQATIPSSSNSNKDGIGVGVGYNGHIQLNSSSGVTLHNSTFAASLKRPPHAEVIRHNSAVVSARSKTKKVKPNDSAINYVSSVVQLDASGNKNHFPVVAVSLQNGLTNPQTIAFGNIPGVRNSSNHPLRIHPPITMREAQVTDTRTSGDSANIVLGSGIPSAGFVIADSIKPIKNDGTGAIRLDGTKLISKGAISAGSTSAGSISLVGSPSTLGGGSTTVTTPTVPHQGQVYFSAVSGSNNTQLLQQLLNYKTLGKNTGVKLLGPNQNTVTGNRQTFVLQQEKEPS